MNKKNQNIFMVGVVLFLSATVFSYPFETVGKTDPRVMIRKIVVPTLANLDCAAYFNNPVRRDPQKVNPKPPARKISVSEMTFGGALLAAGASLSQTPLTKAELESPLAWDPLQNRLWEATKSDAFARITSAVSGVKWGDASVFMPYQEIVAVYLHGVGDSTTLWAGIEFKPWVGFLEGINDEDKDGFREIYGKLSLSGIDDATREKAISWIRSDYSTKILTPDEVVDWANVLASYWYPKLNTDIVDLNGQVAGSEKKLRQKLKKEIAAGHQIVAIRGKPFGKIIHNAFVTPRGTENVPASGEKSVSRVAAPHTIDSTVADNFSANNLRFRLETKLNGDYPEWVKKDTAFRSAMGTFVNALPPGQMGFAGKDGWIFFRNEIYYLNCGDLGKQDKEMNPIPSLLEFRKYLGDKNISLLFCVVPNKSDVYFEKLPADGPRDPAAIINPYGRKFLLDLQTAGVEVIDLLPAFLEAKNNDSTSAEPLYQKHDTHWTSRCLAIAAHIISERIKRYSWYSETAKNAVGYSIKDTFCFRQGDLVDKLPENEKAAFPADSIDARQVYNPDGTLYKPSHPEAPLMLIGDSFTGVFELVDCKGAGVGAHIAAATGVPVDIITSWGGGPLVREKMVRARANNLGNKRVVVYMMVARDLFNYSQKWTTLNSK